MTTLLCISRKWMPGEPSMQSYILLIISRLRNLSGFSISRNSLLFSGCPPFCRRLVPEKKNGREYEENQKLHPLGQDAYEVIAAYEVVENHVGHAFQGEYEERHGDHEKLLALSSVEGQCRDYSEQPGKYRDAYDGEVIETQPRVPAACIEHESRARYVLDDKYVRQGYDYQQYVYRDKIFH